MKHNMCETNPLPPPPQWEVILSCMLQVQEVLLARSAERTVACFRGRLGHSFEETTGMTANELACLRSGWNGARLLWPSATDGAVKISQPSSVGSVRN